MMSETGAVIIANNTDKFDYVKLAEISAEKIKSNLNIPVALISDQPVTSNKFDVIIHNTQEYRYNVRGLKAQKFEWKNLSRTNIFNLTPWDKTLLVDADFLVQTESLKNHLLSDVDFAIARDCFDPVTGYTYVKKLGKTQIDQLWATVIIFNKSKLPELIFQLADYVLENYDYYHRLYNFPDIPLRNDYAFSIACHLLGGYSNRNFNIPAYQLVNCDWSAAVEEVKQDSVLISYKKEVQNQIKTYVQRIKSDVHLMDKISLFGAI